MQKRFKMKTVADVLHWEPFLEDDQVASLKEITCPARVGTVEAPQDLNDITLGQLIQLEAIAAEKGVFAAIAEVLLDKDEAWAMKAPAMEMLGLRNMVVAEQDRIAALFASLTGTHAAWASATTTKPSTLHGSAFGSAARTTSKNRSTRNDSRRYSTT